MWRCLITGKPRSTKMFPATERLVSVRGETRVWGRNGGRLRNKFEHACRITRLHFFFSFLTRQREGGRCTVATVSRKPMWPSAATAYKCIGWRMTHSVHRGALRRRGWVESRPTHPTGYNPPPTLPLRPKSGPEWAKRADKKGPIMGGDFQKKIKPIFPRSNFPFHREAQGPTMGAH